MISKLDFSKIVPIEKMSGDSPEDTNLLKSMLVEAKNFLLSLKWCNSILESYFGLGIGEVIGIFLFKIEPSRDDVDDYVWIIIGDLPPLYLTTDGAPNPACALDGYIGAMEEWAEAAIEGRDVSGLVPVDAEPSKKNGENLKKRLEFIDKNILVEYQNDLT